MQIAALSSVSVVLPEAPSDKDRELGKRVAREAAVRGHLYTRVQHCSGPYRNQVLKGENKHGTNPVIFMVGNACLSVADLKNDAEDPLIEGAFLTKMYQEVEQAAKCEDSWKAFQKEYEGRIKRRTYKGEQGDFLKNSYFKASDIDLLIKLIEGIDKKLHGHYLTQLEMRREYGKQMLTLLNSLTVPGSHRFDKREYQRIISETAQALIFKRTTEWVYYNTCMTSLQSVFDLGSEMLTVRDIQHLNGALNTLLYHALKFPVEDISLVSRRIQRFVQQGPSFISWSYLKLYFDSQGFMDRLADVDLSEKLAYKATPEIDREALAYDLACVLGLESALIPKKKTHLGITLLPVGKQKQTHTALGSVSTFVSGTQVVKTLNEALQKAKEDPEEKDKALKAYLDRINLDSYQDLVCLSLALREMDGNQNQYNVDPQGKIQSLDMGRHSPPAQTWKVPFRPGEHVLTMVCNLFDFPQFKLPLTNRIKEKILALDLEEVSRQLDRLCLPPQNEQKKILDSTLLLLDKEDLPNLKHLWTMWAKPTKMVPLDEFTNAEELRPLVRVLLETKRAKLSLQQNTYRYLHPKAKEKMMDRLRGAQKHLRETLSATPDTLFRALYPDVSILVNAIRTVPGYELWAGGTMGMCENTLEIFYNLIKESKALDPQKLAELKDAIVRLTQDSMDTEEMKAITVIF